MKFEVAAIELLERDVSLRLPFRFGVVTLTAAPQAFVRCRVRCADGREAEGAAAELLVPKWFDKDPALSNADNFDQLRASLGAAREAYLAAGSNTAWGHFLAHARPGLVAGYGPALVERAALDALCRAQGVSFYEALRRNLIGAGAFEGLDLPAVLAGLRPVAQIAARHTVGLLDAISAADARARVNDGLPETLEEVIARYGHRYFKLKVSGDVAADLERLAAIAAVLDRIAQPYCVSLDGNEQFDDMAKVAELWRRMSSDQRLERLTASVLFIEQPVTRRRALQQPVEGIERPVIIDESDDGPDAFPRARALGYRGVSSKTCKGIYRSLINRARCARWNADEGSARYFMSGEDLTIQPGLALQQDLALASLLGLTHVERNGHHYVNGMAALPPAEQAAFLAAHPDLYERSHGAVRPRIERGLLAIGSLACAGYASAAMPDWNSMQSMTIQGEHA
ncbi:MAG: mandelate racemase [Betaproteobacteria bacterium]|nr:MAG: mandelate racemase [Betaproteobacteria bacterium]